VYGTVSGINCRRKICKLKFGETMKYRFGVYLAKDFIPFCKRSDLISDSNYHHYHILVNSQVFELTSDRNNISNEDDPKVKWVLDEAKRILNEDIRPLAEEGYFRLRKQEEEENIIRTKRQVLKKRVEKFEKMDNLILSIFPITKKPDCESQVAILFTAILSNEKSKHFIKYIDKIGHYSQQDSTDMICIDKSGKKILVEVENKLSNLFLHEHPYDTFDYVICWMVDMEMNEKRKLYDGCNLTLLKESEEWILKYGTQKTIPIIELCEVVKKMNFEMRKVL
jgi:hypothetical protein